MSGGGVYIRVLGIEARLDLELALAGTAMALRTPLAAVALWRALPRLRENRRRVRASVAPPRALTPSRAAPAPRRNARRSRRDRRSAWGRARPPRRPISC